MINPIISPAGYIIEKGIEIALKKIQTVSADGTLEELELEAKKAEIQARVAQEWAIADRILNAETVEIEEFYDVSGAGNLGVGADLKAKKMNVGASGDGKKVTKRIYKFSGLINKNSDDQNKNENECDSTVNFTMK